MEGGAYQDDRSIADGDDLLRRLHPSHVVRDENLQRMRVSSAAFTNPPDGTPMSVILASVLFEAEREFGSVLNDYPEHALVSITAGLARECEQGVAPEPLPEEPAHAVVFGHKPPRIRKRFAREAKWVIPPEPPALE